MAKGIRHAVNAKFVKMLEVRNEIGNVEFRRAVINFAVAMFDISVASAATHYNHAFKVARANGLDCGDLGRAEDKKGGRPKKSNIVAVALASLVNVVRAKDGVIVAGAVSRELAEAMVAKAVKQKKAKLIIM